MDTDVKASDVISEVTDTDVKVSEAISPVMDNDVKVSDAINPAMDTDLKDCDTASQVTLSPFKSIVNRIILEVTKPGREENTTHLDSAEHR